MLGLRLDAEQACNHTEGTFKYFCPKKQDSKGDSAANHTQYHANNDDKSVFTQQSKCHNSNGY